MLEVVVVAVAVAEAAATVVVVVAVPVTDGDGDGNEDCYEVDDGDAMVTAMVIAMLWLCRFR